MLRTPLRSMWRGAVVCLVVVAPSFATAQSDGRIGGGPPAAQSIFPTDLLTVFDASQRTRRRVNLPKPDCASRPSDCNDVDVLNTLDGFNLQPRVAVRFGVPIDVASVGRDSILFVPIRRLARSNEASGERIGINQVVWDPDSLTLYAEADELLDQSTRYALVVTRDIRQLDGRPIERATHASLSDAHDVGRVRRSLYQRELLVAERGVIGAGVPASEIAALSVFTTQSATAVLEQIRRQLDARPVTRPDFQLGSEGERTSFDLDDVLAITFQRQVSTQPSFAGSDVPLAALATQPGAAGRIAFGRYRSPEYRNELQFIPPTATRTGVPRPQLERDIVFNLILPSGRPPRGGWPVAIFGHGFSGDKESLPLFAALMASRGIATIGINVAGHGGGPLGTLEVLLTSGRTARLLAGGRGIDQDGDGAIGSIEGLTVNPAAPQRIISSRDGIRQTVIDLMQLVRVIQAGVDVDDDGRPELDRERVYYFGQSLGGIYGTVLLGVEPGIRAGVPNVGGGFLVDVARLSPVFRPLVGIELISRVPSLINLLGPTGLEFDDNTPLRNLPPIVNDVPGAIEIQTVLENTQWVSNSGDAVPFAPHIRKQPLPGVPAKPVIVQFAQGDQTVPNPTSSALIRAGELTDRTTLLRNDLLFAMAPDTTPPDPHLFLGNIGNPLLGVAAQLQIAVFFATDGHLVIDPDGRGRIYEVPIEGDLPENLNFIGAPMIPFDAGALGFP